MFAVGEKIVYGNNGVCTVLGHCPSPFPGDERPYYLLKPDAGGTEIYTPAEGGRVEMRPLLSAEEAEAILKAAPSLPALTVENERARREVYRDVLKKTDPASLFSLVKTVKARRALYAEGGKRIPDFEAEYEASAKKRLSEELSLILGRPIDL